MTALFYLEEGDYLAVMNYYPEVHINYRSNSTFFGAVLLKWWEKKGEVDKQKLNKTYWDSAHLHIIYMYVLR